MEILSEQNFDYFAKLKYNNPGCNSIEEFNERFILINDRKCPNYCCMFKLFRFFENHI